MGTIIKAECHCGFKTNELYLGAGMQNFMDISNIPALKKNASNIKMLNYKEKKKYPDHLFYNDPELTGLSNSSVSIEWDGIAIFEQYNFCPQCKKYSLSFIPIGLFD